MLPCTSPTAISRVKPYPLFLAAFSTLLLASACRTPLSADDLPAHLQGGPLRSAVYLEQSQEPEPWRVTNGGLHIRVTKSKGGIVHCGSGVLVSENLMLTARHYFDDIAIRQTDGSEFAWIQVTCFGRPMPWAARPDAPPAQRQSTIRFVRVTPRELDAEGDWVLLRAEAPCWSPQDIATLHMPLLKSDSALAPCSGWLIGFPADLREAGIREGRVPNGPYAIGGTLTADADRAILADGRNRKAPLGASGSGMHIDTPSGLELVGVFVTWQGQMFQTSMGGVSLHRIVAQARLAGVDLVAEQERTRQLVAGEPMLRAAVRARLDDLKLDSLDTILEQRQRVEQRLAAADDPLTRQLLGIALAAMPEGEGDEAKAMARVRAAIEADPTSPFLRLYGPDLRALLD